MGKAGCMKQLITIVLGVFLSSLLAQAQFRTFTNKEGKKVSAELVAVEGDSVVMQLVNSKISKVPLASLSAEDQLFIKEWWEENKNKVGPMEMRLTIDRKSDSIMRKTTRSGGERNNQQNNNNGRSQKVVKLIVNDYHYVCKVDSTVRKEIKDITVEYTIYKRTVGRDKKDGLQNVTEEIEGTTTIKKLDAFGSAFFETPKVRCESSSEKGGDGPARWKRDTILGIVVTLSAGGNELLRQSDPVNFLERMEEKEEREGILP